MEDEEYVGSGKRKLESNDDSSEYPVTQLLQKRRKKTYGDSNRGPRYFMWPRHPLQNDARRTS